MIQLKTHNMKDFYSVKKNKKEMIKKLQENFFYKAVLKIRF
jgi:hypothetical protein